MRLVPNTVATSWGRSMSVDTLITDAGKKGGASFNEALGANLKEFNSQLVKKGGASLGCTTRHLLRSGS
jgi:hypothetical protein